MTRDFRSRAPRSATAVVTEHMRQHGFNVGGEQSGHIVLSDFTTTGDGLVSSLQVAGCVVATASPVSEVCARFHPLPQVLRNVRYANGKPSKAVACAAPIRREQKAPVMRGGSSFVHRQRAVIRDGQGDDERLVNFTVVGDIVEAVKAAAQAA